MNRARAVDAKKQPPGAICNSNSTDTREQEWHDYITPVLMYTPVLTMEYGLAPYSPSVVLVEDMWDVVVALCAWREIFNVRIGQDDGQ